MSVAVCLCYAGGLIYTAGFLILFTGTLDILDGKVARRSNGASASGAFRDSVIDRYAEYISYVGLIIFFGSGWQVWAVLLAILGGMMVSYTRARGEGLGVSCEIGMLQRPERFVLLGFGSIFSSIFVHATGIEGIICFAGDCDARRARQRRHCSAFLHRQGARLEAHERAAREGLACARLLHLMLGALAWCWTATLGLGSMILLTGFTFGVGVPRRNAPPPRKWKRTSGSEGAVGVSGRNLRIRPGRRHLVTLLALAVRNVDWQEAIRALRARTMSTSPRCSSLRVDPVHPRAALAVVPATDGGAADEDLGCGNQYRLHVEHGPAAAHR
jgi:phosphatidylglycerophosphate synthase